MQPKGKALGNLSKETQEYLESWSESADESLDALADQLLELKNLYKEKQDLSDEEAEKAARGQVYSNIAGAVQSDAVPLEGFILGPTGKKRDANAPKKYRIKQKFKDGDPQTKEEMVSQGKVKQGEDGEPIPLETNENSPTPVGDPIQPFWNRTVIGIARLEEDGSDFKFLNMNLQGDHADLKVPSGTPVKFKAMIDEETSEIIETHSSNLTEFKGAEVEDLDGVDWIDIFDSADEEYYATLEELGDWHTEHSDDWDRVVFTEGTVSNVGNSTNVIGMYTIVLTDESLGLEGDAVFVNIDEGQREEVDFERGARLAVIGRTREAPDGRINIRAFGFYPRYQSVSLE